jgi:hypothetical protein
MRPDFAPVDVGLKRMLNVWLSPGAITAPAGSTVNSAALELSELIVNDELPEFFTTTLSDRT